MKLLELIRSFFKGFCKKEKKVIEFSKRLKQKMKQQRRVDGKS